MLCLPTTWPVRDGPHIFRIGVAMAYVRNEPDPDYYEFEANGHHVGEARSAFHDFLLDDDYEAILEELKEKDLRRIKPGFNVKDS